MTHTEMNFMHIIYLDGYYDNEDNFIPISRLLGEMRDYLIETGLTTARDINRMTEACGNIIETMELILYICTGYNTFEEFIADKHAQ